MEFLAILVSLVAIFVAWSKSARIGELDEKLRKVQATLNRMELENLERQRQEEASKRSESLGEVVHRDVAASVGVSVGLGSGVGTSRDALPVPKAPVGASMGETKSGSDGGVVDRFVEWLREDWLLKLGALLVIMAFGWLVSYAFVNNWIGPAGRITLGVVSGVGFMLFGWWRQEKVLQQGNIFVLLGATVVLVSIYAARSVYDFFTPEIALLGMFLTSAFVTYLSLSVKSRSLALSGVIFAFLAPMLTNTPDPNVIGLFAYLLVIVLGSIWVVVLNGQEEVALAGLLGVMFYSLPQMGSLRGDSELLVLFAYVLAAIFFVVGVIGLKSDQDRKYTAEIVIAALNALLLLMWIVSSVPENWQSMILSVWAIVFVSGAYLLFGWSGRRVDFYVHASIAVCYVAAATAAELEGAALTIAFTIEVALIIAMVYVVLKDIKAVRNASWLFVIPVILSFASMGSSEWNRGVLHSDFFVLLVLTGALLGTGVFIYSWLRRAGAGDMAAGFGATTVMGANTGVTGSGVGKGGEAGEEDVNLVAKVLVNGGAIYAYILVWLVYGAMFVDMDTAIFYSLLTYTLVGLGIYYYGFYNWRKTFQTHGAVVLGLVVARLLIVDVWGMDLVGRIVTFFVIGVLLLSTAFYTRNRNNMMSSGEGRGGQ
jgi:uncharacterized membrane protein